MGLISLGFLLGVAALQQFRGLPPLELAWLLVIVAPLLVYRPGWRLPLAAACGFLWALWQAGLVLEQRLAPALEGADLIVTGTIASIPRTESQVSRFMFDVGRITLPDASGVDGPSRVRLNWYGVQDELKVGHRWRLLVRLKQPRGFSNPGGFDYEAWLFQHRIQATGYVRGEASALPGFSPRYAVGRLRQKLAEDINAALAGRENAGIAVALTVGERSGIAPDKWRLLIDTGTVHLLAISGLHIGLVAGFFYMLVRRGLRLAPRLCLRWPAHKAAALAGLVGGFGYALLAGFSVPTQRALIMLAVLVGAIMSARNLSAVQVLGTALLAVLVWDPLSVLSPGFWLSFMAVAAIVYSVVSRPYRRQRWWRWGRIQWMLALALLPLTLLFFQRGALIAPVANLIAVPWVSLVVVPLTLLGSGLLGLIPAAGEALLIIADAAIDQLWWVLQALSEWPHASWRHRSPPWWSLIPVLIGALLLLAPRGWPARWVGLILLLPLAALSPSRPHDSEFWFHLLDVGQGLAAVVETRTHALVFDTGARYSDRFNMGEAVLAPFLRDRGVSVVDKLVISHGDNDHIGGASALLRNFEVKEILTSEPERFQDMVVRRCARGQRWEWDGVRFEILHPAPEWSSSRNNSSCVLRVSGRGGSVLMTADIEREAEQNLLKTQARDLASDVMLVPHHGSTTSSSAALLQAVDPELALIAAGHLNRFGLPAPEIVQRYLDRDIRVLNTARQGAISLHVHPRAGINLLNGHRQRAQRYWTAR